MKITRNDPRYIILDGCTNEIAIKKGCKFRAWINVYDMGGWIGDNKNEFFEAIQDEMRFTRLYDGLTAPMIEEL